MKAIWSITVLRKHGLVSSWALGVVCDALSRHRCTTRRWTQRYSGTGLRAPTPSTTVRVPRHPHWAVVGVAGPHRAGEYPEIL